MVHYLPSSCALVGILYPISDTECWMWWCNVVTENRVVSMMVSRGRQEGAATGTKV